MSKLPKAQRAMLERLGNAGDKGIMRAALLGSGGSARTILRRLYDAGLAEPCEVQLAREAVAGARITTDGRAAIAKAGNGA